MTSKDSCDQQRLMWPAKTYVLQCILLCNTVDTRYLELAYLEYPLISKWKFGPCYNTEIYQQATKYCGKEEKLLLRSNFSSFPQYFQYISNLGVKLHIHSVKGGCSINCFPQFRKSDMSKYGYLEVFHGVPWSSTVFGKNKICLNQRLRPACTSTQYGNGARSYLFG